MNASKLKVAKSGGRKVRNREKLGKFYRSGTNKDIEQYLKDKRRKKRGGGKRIKEVDIGKIIISKKKVLKQAR